MACAHCSGRSAGVQWPRSQAASAARAPVCDAVVEGCACGGLETHCRPRWVAGMVIQESDLNRLDAYMLSKQRLHNRNLHGTGVACGLIVTCHPCGEGVVSVSPGYAIGPCGEDIVVPSSDAVDVCALIRTCRSQERRTVECRPWGDDRGCEEVTEQWILAIRYDEQPSRGSPLLRAGSRDCGCGGSCGGDCGCGGHASKPKASRREVPTACAPTVTCETYRYEAFRAPAHPPCSPAPAGLRGEPTPAAAGQNPSRLLTCLRAVFDILSARPASDLNEKIDERGKREWIAYCLRLKATLRDHLLGMGATACALVERICATPCPDPTLDGRSFVAAMNRALAEIAPILMAALKDCLCLSILPPCPKPESDPRIPLALITVDGGGACRVTEICNWTPLRPMVFTFPTIVYWLELFNLMSRLRDMLFRLCCCPPKQRPSPRTETDGVRVRRAAAVRSEEPDLQRDPLFAMFADGPWDELLDGGENPAVFLRMARDALGFLPEPPDVAERLAALEAEVVKLRRSRNT